MSAHWAIETQGLVKRFGNVEALRGLDLRVPQGSLCGLIGANGAGKTTTIKVLLNLVRPTSGTARVLGMDANQTASSLAVRERIAYLPEAKTLFPAMKVRDFLRFVRPFFAKWNHEQEQRLLAKLEIPLGQKLCDLSKGTLGKLHVLVALSHAAELILLDEPTDGLDVLATQVVLEEIARVVAEEGATVLYCSHRLEEIEQLADHLVIVHAGQALLSENMDALRERARRLDAVFSEMPAGIAEWGQFGVLSQDGRVASLLTWRDREAAEEFVWKLGARSVTAHPVSLRQLFVDMIRGQHAVA
jgi:ABC-2 type transport system ATP-binding protein